MWLAEQKVTRWNTHTYTGLVNDILFVSNETKKILP